VKGIRVGGSVANASLGHLLTSHGYVLEANVLLRRGSDHAAFAARTYVNGARYFPGIEATLLDRTTRIRGRDFELTPRVLLWLQPKDQGFRTRSATPGAMASLRIRSTSGSRFRSFVEIEAKSAGWVAGTPYLGAAVGVRSGVTALLR
jgi:hypothetical protein